MLERLSLMSESSCAGWASGVDRRQVAIRLTAPPLSFYGCLELAVSRLN